jgi:hypothetical protein
MFDSHKHISRGKEHWGVEVWFTRVTQFAIEVLGYQGKDLSEEFIAMLVLLINHAFGPSEKKNVNEKILRILGIHGIILFHGIF